MNNKFSDIIESLDDQEKLELAEILISSIRTKAAELETSSKAHEIVKEPSQNNEIQSISSFPSEESEADKMANERDANLAKLMQDAMF